MNAAASDDFPFAAMQQPPYVGLEHAVGGGGGPGRGLPPLGRGLGAGTPTIAVRAPQVTRTGAGPSPEEEPRTDFNHSPSTIRGGALGRLVMPHARWQRKGGKGTCSRHPAGRLTSPAELASGAARKLGTLKASNGGEA